MKICRVQYLVVWTWWFEGKISRALQGPANSLSPTEANLLIGCECTQISLHILGLAPLYRSLLEPLVYDVPSSAVVTAETFRGVERVEAPARSARVGRLPFLVKTGFNFVHNGQSLSSTIPYPCRCPRSVNSQRGSKSLGSRE